MQKPYEINIDLYDSFIRETSANYIAGDIGTMPLTIRLLSCGNPLKLQDGDGVSLNFENAHGVKFARAAVIADSEKGKVLYGIQNGDIAVLGNVNVGVTLTRGEKRLSWHGFSFTVSSNGADGQTEPPEGAVSTQGFFAMTVDDDGGLVLLTNDETPPPLEIDASGNLVYVFEEGKNDKNN